MNHTAQATPDDLKRQKVRCLWYPKCHNRAWLEWMGYRHCLKHWFYSYNWGGGERSVRAFLYRLRHTIVFFK